MLLKKLLFLLLFCMNIFHQTSASNFKPSKWDVVLSEARQINDSVALEQFLKKEVSENQTIHTIFYKVLMAEHYSTQTDQQDPKIIERYTEALSLVNSTGDTGLLIWVETQLGFYYYSLNEYEKALNSFNKTTRALLRSNTHKIPEKASVYKKNAYFFQTIKEYPTSISLLKNALQWCEKSCSEYNSILFSLGCVALISEDYPQAQHYLENSRKTAIQNKDDLQYAKATGELGILQKRLGNFSLAEQLLLEDIEISNKIQENRNLMYARIQLGELYLENNQIDKAYTALNKALKYAQTKAYLKGYEYDIYKSLLQIALLKENTEEEIAIRRHLDELGILLSNTESDAKVNQLNWQAKNEQMQWQLESKSTKLNKARLSVWISSLSFLLITGLITYFYFLNRKKTRIQLEKLDSRILVFQQDKAKAENHLVKTKRSLGAYQQYLEEKNVQVELLQKELIRLKNENNTATFEKHKIGLEELLDSHLMTDENWDYFKKSFITEKEIVYDAIKQQLPDLTESNMRMVMLQLLGLNNIQTANTLGVTQEAVKKGKQRLRKKYGDRFDTLLEEFQNLELHKN